MRVKSTAGIIISLVIGIFTLVMPTIARAATIEPTSMGNANMISYADSDFESGVGNWVNSSNATLSQDTNPYLHNNSLRMAASAAGTAAIKMGGGASPPQVPVTAGNTYRLSAWLKTAQSGRTIAYAMGFYNSAGTWLGWTSATAKTLSTPGSYQYISETVTAPTGAAYALGSPRITETGMNAGEALNIDEVQVRPLRAATLIGAEDPSGNAGQFSTANAAIGPLQSDKIFYSPSSALPASYTGSICDNLPDNVTCVISYKVQNTNVASFVGSIPAGRTVVLEWWQEPENDTFTGSGTNGQNFVTDFEAQSNLIRSSTTAANRANVFVADNAMTYQYAAGTNHNLGGAGGSCSFIPPSSYVDTYLADHYEFTSSGNNVSVDSGGQGEWNGWLNCVKGQNKPIGIAELGYNCTASPNFANSPSTSTAITADAAYLQGEPDGLPVNLLEYWWDPNGFTGGNCQFTDSTPENAWKTAETANGGGQ